MTVKMEKLHVSNFVKLIPLPRFCVTLTSMIDGQRLDCPTFYFSLIISYKSVCCPHHAGRQTDVAICPADNQQVKNYYCLPRVSYM